MYQTFRNMKIDHGAIGLEQREAGTPWFCTPRGAEIIGWAGVDGIHYCRIPEFGEMIFAVSPMNIGEYVHPVARNFRELLCMLLVCGDMAALEQCYAWEVEQYKAFLTDYPATAAQRAVLDALRDAFGLEPAADVFNRVKELQKDFDLSAIPYTEDYYDADMNPAAPVQKEWKVTYDGGFWGGPGKAGEEVAIKKSFRWGQENWYVPAVYLCGKGLVAELCKEVAPEVLEAYITRWDLHNGDESRYTDDQREQMERENPLDSSFRATAVVNGRQLRSERGSGLTWVPAQCLPQGCDPNPEGKQVTEHYGLDPEKCWEFRRCSFPWKTARKPKVKSLVLELERHPEQITGACFDAPWVGECVTLVHPQTGVEYVLTVQEYEEKVLPGRAFPGDGMEYPRNYRAMAYSLTPELPGLMIRDCAQSEEPRRKAAGLTAEEAAALGMIGGADGPVSTGAIGIIGGSDGPTALILGSASSKLRVACSALRFEAAENVRWKAVFSVKQMEDITVSLL